MSGDHWEPFIDCLPQSDRMINFKQKEISSMVIERKEELDQEYNYSENGESTFYFF